MSSPTSIVAYLALFAAMGFAFLFVNLLIGRLLRPQDPHPEKLEVYECGEPTIGSSFVQFDLRFYVVALLFIIFAASFFSSTGPKRATSSASRRRRVSRSLDARGLASFAARFAR